MTLAQRLVPLALENAGPRDVLRCRSAVAVVTGQWAVGYGEVVEPERHGERPPHKRWKPRRAQ